MSVEITQSLNPPGKGPYKVLYTAKIGLNGVLFSGYDPAVPAGLQVQCSEDKDIPCVNRDDVQRKIYVECVREALRTEDLLLLVSALWRCEAFHRKKKHSRAWFELLKKSMQFITTKVADDSPLWHEWGQLQHWSSELSELAEAFNDLKLAEQHYRRTISLSPKDRHSTLHNNLGLCLKKQGRLLEALDEYEKAYQLGGVSSCPISVGNALQLARQHPKQVPPDVVARWTSRVKNSPHSASGTVAINGECLLGGLFTKKREDTYKIPHDCGLCGVVSRNHLLCGGCRAIRYCGVDCQNKHWKEHKKACKAVQKHMATTKKVRPQANPG
eukprot:TRINITY_DN47961_c0_g1_i1.p1 TRINITY_DN47961_c0_g1~~TRINITY_DN47961_c0_g1_i1.p1  ORF type:complete len:335 (-),score=-7.65 TRINITY_DN47961_c0_g1_i1:51-1034(-)